MAYTGEWPTLDEFFVSNECAARGAIAVPDDRLVYAAIAENVATRSGTRGHEHLQTDRTDELAAGGTTLFNALLLFVDKLLEL